MIARWLGGLSAVVVVLLAVGWWWGWFEREDPLIAKTREIAETPREAQTKEQQTELRDAWQERMKGMSEDQRQAMFEQMAPIFVPMMMRQFERDYDKFMAMTPEERNQELDKRIDAMQTGGGGRGRGFGGGGGGGGGGRPNVDPKRMAEFQKKMLAWTTPEQRAKFDNGMQMFAKRMKQRGLTPPQMPGGGFF